MRSGHLDRERGDDVELLAHGDAGQALDAAAEQALLQFLLELLGAGTRGGDDDDVHRLERVLRRAFQQALGDEGRAETLPAAASAMNAIARRVSERLNWRDPPG